jgi:hypothetical protein
MTRIVSGTVHGNTIELDEDLGIAEGQAVEVQVKLVPLKKKKEWGEGILRTAGALAGDPEWDAAMEEVYQARKQDRPPTVDSTE